MSFLFYVFHPILRPIFHFIHLIGFSFILGNMISDKIFGARKLQPEQYTTLSLTYRLSWISMIVTGIWQIMIISREFNYVKNKKYMTWIKLLLFKTIFTFISAYGLEYIAKFIIPLEYKKKFLKYFRILCYIILFILSGLIREYREVKLKRKIDKINNDNNNNKDKIQ